MARNLWHALFSFFSTCNNTVLKQNYLCDTKNFNVTLKECLWIQFVTKALNTFTYLSVHSKFMVCTRTCRHYSIYFLYIWCSLNDTVYSELSIFCFLDTFFYNILVKSWCWYYKVVWDHFIIVLNVFTVYPVLAEQKKQSIFCSVPVMSCQLIKASIFIL